MGKEKKKRKNNPTRWITFHVHANEIGRKVLNIKLDAVVILHHQNTEVYLIYDRVSIPEPGKMDGLSLFAGTDSFFPQTSEKRVGVKSRRSGR